ncbi:hypothetical protein ACPFL9_15795 [Paenarthrobacter sp. NyZ202]|uniref:hypothetical protein n=1 Tax=Paenarthrobacter sp. NyZ202 TaxID=3402689 RepID=UPI003CF9CA03
MTFFDDLPEPPARPRQPQPIRPGWAGPPSDELPGVAHIGEFIHSSQRAVVALKSVEVYSTGCVLELMGVVRRGQETDREWRDVMEQVFQRPGASDGAGFLIGVAYPDGRRAVASQPMPPMFEDADIAGPVLVPIGGGGANGGDHSVEVKARYWLWPLPVDGDCQVVAKWDTVGVDESSVVLASEVLGSGLARIRKFWAG